MKLAKYGILEWAGGGVVLLVLCGVGLWLGLCWCSVTGWVIILLAVLFWLVQVFAFRVPNRQIPEDEDVLVSPADGVITDLGLVHDHCIDIFEGQDLLRIGITHSLLDVRVIRAPCPLTVEYKRYKNGTHSVETAKESDRLIIAGMGAVAGKSFPLAICKKPKFFTRHTVCKAEPGTLLDRGEVFGMMKFGERTELYLPSDKWMKLEIDNGDKVSGGSTIIARIAEQTRLL